MATLPMADAAEIADMTRDGLRRALKRANIKVIETTPQFHMVDEDDLKRFVENRIKGRGRPRKAGTVTP